MKDKRFALIIDGTRLALGSSLLLIFITTLFPYIPLVDGSYIKLSRMLQMPEPNLANKDFIQNIFLFMPLGMSLTHLLSRLQWGFLWRLIPILFVSAVISFSVEWIQLIIPYRTPGVMDIISNTLGGGIGCLVYGFWKQPLIDRGSVVVLKGVKQVLTGPLNVVFIGYMILVCALSGYSQSFMGLNNWSMDFPLLLGNEKTGERPWKGCAHEFWIDDKALSETAAVKNSSTFGKPVSGRESLLYHCKFNDGKCLDDGSLLDPDWVWHGGKPRKMHSEKVCLDDYKWLETRKSAHLFSKKIKDSNQFSLGIIATPANIIQKGPARILSLSEDTQLRNFTLGQQGTDLVFRLRTPFTGNNGAQPELRVHDVLRKEKIHAIVATFDGSLIALYVDGQKAGQMEFTPGMMLLASFLHPFEKDKYYSDPKKGWLAHFIQTCKMSFILIVFFPMGFLLALIVQNKNRSLTNRGVIFCVGTIVFPAALEIVLIMVSGKPVYPVNPLLGSGVVAFSGILHLVGGLSLWGIRWKKSYT